MDPVLLPPNVTVVTKSRSLPFTVILPPVLAGLGAISVMVGSNIFTCGVELTSTREAKPSLTAPSWLLAGTLTTIFPASMLSNVLTLLPPGKVISLVKSRSVPSMLRFAPAFTGLGEIELTVGTVMSSGVVDSIKIGSSIPFEITNTPDCASAGTSTSILVSVWLLKAVTDFLLLKMISLIRLRYVPLMVKVAPGRNFAGLKLVIAIGSEMVNKDLEVIFPCAVFRLTLPSTVALGTSITNNSGVLVLKVVTSTLLGKITAVTWSRLVPMKRKSPPRNAGEGPKLLSCTKPLAMSSSFLQLLSTKSTPKSRKEN